MHPNVDTLFLNKRRLMAGGIQGFVAGLALAASFLLRFDFALDPAAWRMLWAAVPLVVGVKIATYCGFGLANLPWRYLGFPDLVRIASANVVASAATAAAMRFLLGSAFPGSLYVIDLLLCLTLIVAALTGIKLWLDRATLVGGAPARRIVIYGAGQAGSTLAQEVQQHPAMGYRVAGFLDDDPAKRNLRIHGVRVLGGLDELARAVRAVRASEVLIALPTISGNRLTAILEQCRTAEVTARRVPTLAELLGERSMLVQQIRDVRLEDLLGRPPVQLTQEAVRRRLAGRVVLVTGAGGSIGSELCRQIARYAPAAIVGFDHGETALYDVEQELAERFPDVAFYPAVGSLRDRRRLREVFRDHRPQSVYHAAAYKHVPMMEAHLFEAIENNVFGTRHVARAAVAAGCEEFVLVSSDKAVGPSSVMGATKRLAELICLGMSTAETVRFVAVRFGNVLGSSGSVIPRFRRQIAQGGPVTVTHPEMRRFFMTIPEAAQLVLEATALGQGGEVFVLEMGEPVRIADLARKMVVLSGLRPDEDIPIVYSGVRPGEKLFEELHAADEELVPTQHRQIRAFTGGLPSGGHLEDGLRALRQATEARDAAGVVMCLKGLVPNYNPSSAVLRQAFSQQISSPSEYGWASLIA